MKIHFLLSTAALLIILGLCAGPVSSQTWTAQSSGVTTPLYSASTVDQNNGWVAGASGVVLRTTDGGATWVNVGGSPIGTAAVYAIYGLDANTCVLTTSPSATYVYRTTNGGTTWTEVFTQAGGFMDDFEFKNANTGVMYGDPVGGRWSLWKTTDGGATWDSTGMYLPQAGTEAGWNNAMCSEGDNLWFGTNNTRVYKSTDFGMTWTYGVTTGSANSYSVGFNGNTGFSGQSVTLKSTDGGDNWSSVMLPGTGAAYAFTGGVTGRFWYCRGGSVHASVDNGANFSMQYTGTGTFYDISMKIDGMNLRGWAVSSTGSLVMYNETLSGITSNQNEIPNSYALMQNYPNPFNPTTTIRFSLPKSAIVSLKVYNTLGKEVATLFDGNLNTGSYNVNWDANGFASGVYFYRLKTDNFVETKKMILLK